MEPHFCSHWTGHGCGGDGVSTYRRGLKSGLNRRSFLFRTGAFAAASAMGSSLLGCADNGVVIPCLGSAAPPAEVLGMTYVWASKIGCALDCDLRSGRNKYHGGSATDDGPRINAALANSSEQNPITLIIDGSALISGLFLPAGGYWNIAGLGCGTGFFIKSWTNNDGIHNGGPGANVPADPGPPAPARGKSVSLRNFTLNGNRGNGHNGDSTTGLTQGGKRAWYIGINLMDLDDITIENVVVVNTPSYHMRLSNVGNVRVSGCVMHTHGYNTDGIHFDGPANDISISSCDFELDDDSIALNCPEGHSGDISRVVVTNCTFNSWSLMRLYTASNLPGQFKIEDVQVSDCRGTLTEMAFAIGLNGESLPDSVASLTVEDCDLTTPMVIGVSENFGAITLRNIKFTPSISHAVWVRPQYSHMPAILRPGPINGTIDWSGSTLVVENCVIYRDSNVVAAAVILENASVIQNLVINGFSVVDAPKTTPAIPALLEIADGRVNQLVVNSANGGNVSAAVRFNDFSTIGSVSGSGVLPTGWAFADAVMVDNVPYISASTGLPSIKIAGVVEEYYS